MFSNYGSNFASIIQSCVSSANWRAQQLDNTNATLEFQGKSGRAQTLFITFNAPTVIFRIYAKVKFANENKIPLDLTGMLLRRNSLNLIGKWTLISPDNISYIFSYVHAINLKDIEPQLFQDIVQTMIIECDEWENILNQSGYHVPNQM